MSPARPWFRPALLITTALLLTSCGIPETGVVEAGEPATGIRPAHLLYFVNEGTLLPVRRQATGQIGIETAVDMVFRGPDIMERRKGVTTDLPRLTVGPTVRTDGGDGGRVSIELPWGTGPLTDTALTQLICTVADARLLEAPDTDTASMRVTVTVPDAWHTKATGEACPSVTSAD
ncbi:hypothetical protein AB0D57_01600 [Streptomyces sp. NPDC048275]|uniref:hypothetical protein n=1 Tax=Streptomyces sp. NPDC048275 TaxID=3155629 RepID=UPI0033FE3C77